MIKVSMRYNYRKDVEDDVFYYGGIVSEVPETFGDNIIITPYQVFDYIGMELSDTDEAVNINDVAFHAYIASRLYYFDDTEEGQSDRVFYTTLVGNLIKECLLGNFDSLDGFVVYPENLKLYKEEIRTLESWNYESKRK